MDIHIFLPNFVYDNADFAKTFGEEMTAKKGNTVAVHLLFAAERNILVLGKRSETFAKRDQAVLFDIVTALEDTALLCDVLIPDYHVISQVH